MKKFHVLLAFITALTLALSGCGIKPNPVPDPAPGPGDVGGDIGGDVGGGDDRPVYEFIYDGELTDAKRDKQATIDTLAATDDFGRSFDIIDGYKTDKDRYVALFYFAWLGQHAAQTSGIYDITELSANNPDALWNAEGTPDSPLNEYHFWGEPLYGYYNSLDPWVIRKQVELFCMTGIDVLVFDVTNTYCYLEVVERVLNVLSQYNDDGWNVPKIMFYTNTNSAETVRFLYSGTGNASHCDLQRYGIYKRGEYSELWFCPNGKPQIVAVTDPANTSTSGDYNKYLLTTDERYVSYTRNINAEMLAFFDVWETTWPSWSTTALATEKGLPWMDWTTTDGTAGSGGKGQTLCGTDKGGAVSVSVAQHNRPPFSNAINPNVKNMASERAAMWGRGYSRSGGVNHSQDAINSGVNFEEQWQTAFKYDPAYVFVTGWNEWVAGKLINTDGNVMFVDTVNREYSRDIEPMKGGYGDNFFLQLVRNVRAYKGKSGVKTPSAGKSIDIKKGLTQWNGVTSIYDCFDGAINRDFINAAGTETYTDNSVRNDIKSIRVANDDDNVYFLIECNADIEFIPDASNFMNLWIGVDGGESASGFYGYNYVVNRARSELGDCGVDRVVKSNGRLTYTASGEGNFTLNGRYMQFRVSKSALGIQKNAAFTLRFKAADNVTDPEDISSYYVTGTCAPVGRLSYTYTGN